MKLYAKTRLPLIPIYGGFPVKLVTYIGKPIPYDANLTPEELQIKVNKIMKAYKTHIFFYIKLYLKNISTYFQVADSLQDLIRKHQKVPGNITRALVERIRNTEKYKD